MEKGICTYNPQSVDDLVSEAISKKSSAELTDELPPNISAAYDPTDKKVYLNRSIADKRKSEIGGNRLPLAHEYNHMLFDLLPKESQDGIVKRFLTHPNYKPLKELVVNLGWNESNNWDTKNDRRVVGEILAIRSDFKRRVAYERAAGNTVCSAVDYFLELAEPITAGYIANLGFDRSVSAAKEKYREFELAKLNK